MNRTLSPLYGRSVETNETLETYWSNDGVAETNIATSLKLNGGKNSLLIMGYVSYVSSIV